MNVRNFLKHNFDLGNFSNISKYNYHRHTVRLKKNNPTQILVACTSGNSSLIKKRDVGVISGQQFIFFWLLVLFDYTLFLLRIMYKLRYNCDFWSWI